jgi:serine protease inhibitor
MKPIYKKILILIAIAIACCATIVFRQIMENKKTKPRTVTSNHLRQLNMAISAYLLDNGALPPKTEFIKIAKEYGESDETFLDFWEMPIIYQIETDKKYTLYSYGPNKKDDNQKLDDIVCLSTGQVK